MKIPGTPILAIILLVSFMFPFPVSAAPKKSVAATLTRVTYLSDPDHTIVTLELDRKVVWHAGRLVPEEGKPNRIYIDLIHTVLGSNSRDIAIRDRLVEGVRLGQFKPGVARVVLDTGSIESYKISHLSGPSRLVIFMSGGPASEKRLKKPLDSLPAAQPIEATGEYPGSTHEPARVSPQPVASGRGVNVATSDKRNGNGRTNGKSKNSHGHAEVLLLDVSVNTQRLPDIVRAERLADGRLALTLEAWQAARLRLPENRPLNLTDNRRGYALESIPGLTYNLDRSRLTLTISAPAAAFIGSDINYGSLGESPPNLAPFGFYVNYDVSATRSDLHYDSYGAFVEGVAFNKWGSAVAGMIMRGNRQSDQAIRTETFWRKDIPGSMETLVLGDTIGSAASWSRPVRYAGIRWARDFSLRPGFLTMPLPSLSGSATLPSTIDVLINNQLQQRTRVTTGPFDITNVPVVSGAGEINLIVRDLLGRETVVSQSYYISPRLLAAGLADFSLEAGVLRENYGIESNNYGDAFAAGTYMYGLTSALTGETRVELQEKRQAAGMALSSLLGKIGVAQVAAAYANSNGVIGGHYLVSLERSSPKGGGSLRWEYFDRKFRQFASLPGETRLRQQISAGLGMPVFRKVSVGFNYTRQTTWEGDHFSLVSASLGVAMPWNLNLSAYASRRLDKDHDWSCGLSLSKPLGDQRTASISTSAASNSRTVNTAEVSQSLPSGPGFGWRLRASDDRSQQWQAAISRNTNVGSFSAEATSGADSSALRLGANGSIGWLAGLPFATRSIGHGSFAVVRVGDLQGVPIYRSNQMSATTNSSGLAFVPDLLPYQKNQLTVDPAELPFNIEIRGIKSIALPYARSGVLIDFPVRRSLNALLVLRQPDGTPVPAGALITVSPGERRFIVGKRGEAYLMDLAGSNRLSIHWQGGACSFTIFLDTKATTEPRLGPLTCGGR